MHAQPEVLPICSMLNIGQVLATGWLVTKSEQARKANTSCTCGTTIRTVGHVQ
jgi:hypothetical protein